jgi:hypothetical protein
MNVTRSRRAVISGATGIAAGSVAGQLLSIAQAEEAVLAQSSQTGGVCLSMIFEDGPKSKFDTDKYLKNHLPLLRDVYGDSVERIELRVIDGTDASLRMIPVFGGISSPLATTTFWIKDIAAFGQKLAANATRINKELDGLAKANRLVQTDRVIQAYGEPRSAVAADTFVFSLYFRQPKTATAVPVFDQKYFQESYLPALYSGLGPNAVRRLEASMGMVQGGQSPAVIAAYHVFIRDRDAYDLARGALAEVNKGLPTLTQNTTVMFIDMRVRGVV